MKNNVLRKLQLTELEILKEVSRICKKNNIEYFLMDGTLLGAVRHKGFIPWDDDIDIGMLRADYDKFIKACNTELNSDYFLHYNKTDKKYYLSFLKIRKKNTFFDEKQIENINTHKEIFIDIFPLDNVKNPNSKIYKYRKSLYNVLTSIILYRRGVKDKSFLPKPYLRYFFVPFRLRTLLKIQELMMKYDNKKNTKYIEAFPSIYEGKKIVKKEDFFPLVKIEFEDSKFFVPKNYKEYLSKIYGDYMKLPPKSKRKAHCPKNIIFDTRKGE